MKLVVNIASPPHSGSTLLSTILGSHSKIFNIGELAKAFRENRFFICVYCRNNCPIWSKIKQKKFSIDNIYDLLFDITNKDILVDSSKDFTWFLKKHNQKYEVKTKFIFLIRQPEEFVASLKKQRTIFYKGKRISYFPEKAIVRWIEIVQRLLYFYSQYREVSYLVRYEDLAQFPRKATEDICNFIGIEFEPKMLQFWDFEHHYLYGNSSLKRSKEIFFDRDRYKRILTPLEIKLVRENIKIQTFKKIFDYE